MSNQVYGDGSKVLNQEPTEERIEKRHGWWNPVTGVAPLPPEEAKIMDERAAEQRRRRRAAARRAARSRTKEPPVK